MLRRVIIFLLVILGISSLFLIKKPMQKKLVSDSKNSVQTITTTSTQANGVSMPEMRFGGTWSTFGGPEDMNAIREVQGDIGGTGLAAIDNESYLPAGMILLKTDARVVKAEAEAKSRGYAQGIKLIGRLNPDSYYIAMRWPIPYLSIRNGQATGFITNNRTGAGAEVQLVDWGPNISTGKDVDLSPGVMSALYLEPNDTVSFVYVTKNQKKKESFLPKFNYVNWNTPTSQGTEKNQVFELFSPFTNKVSPPISLAQITPAEPIRALVNYMNNLAPAGTARFMSALSETDVRTTLGNAGISINAEPPQTTVAGLGDRAIAGLSYFSNQVGGFTLTGGTESGHDTHGTGNDYIENNVDLGKSTKLNNFIMNGHETRVGTDGTIYMFNDPTGQPIECMDEGNHWHCMFKPEARGNRSETDSPESSGSDNNQNGGGSLGSGSGESSSGSTAFCGTGTWGITDNCCYKQTGPAGPPGQIDGVKYCNAGYKSAAKSGQPPIFVPNCGIGGTGCDRALSISAGGFNLSCLVTVCPPGRNAIWDPQTKRCGCDNGVGGSFASGSSGGSGDTPLPGEEDGTLAGDRDGANSTNLPATIDSGTEAQRRIYEESIKALNNPIACEAPRSSNGDILGCGIAASTILHRAGVSIAGSAGTSDLNNQISNSGLFARVSIDQAQPGDVIISPTVNPVPGSFGHVGIVLTNGATEIASNDSRDGFWRDNYTGRGWINRFNNRNLETIVWRAN